MGPWDARAALVATPQAPHARHWHWRVPKRGAAAMASPARTLYDFEIGRLGAGTREAPVAGGPLDLGAAKGKVALVENVAGL